ncbi:hypothetical protein MKW92_045441 [Papaver armeniacum]|nr:hypothetical protein MKW92_045441 [Papaver armeniacum]
MVQRLIKQPDNIRNVSVVGHVNHGKSNLLGVSLCYKMTSMNIHNGYGLGDEFFFNLMDCPGNAEFSAEVTAALRITDGALVVVDCVQGVRDQTENALRQAIAEKIRPVLTLNKIDRCFLELQLDGEHAYQTLTKTIEGANVVPSTNEDSLLGDVQVYPENGTVAFSAGLHGWAFTLINFARMFAVKFGVDVETMANRLWGDNFFDSATKTWTTYNTSTNTCKRGFVQFCYEPIQQVIKLCMSEDKSKLWSFLDKLGIHMTPEEKKLSGRAFMKTVMQKWLPASTALLEMMVVNLPSPSAAQQYRVDNLYTGPLDDIYANGIRNSDFDGPFDVAEAYDFGSKIRLKVETILYISKMICASDNGKFLALGRVFSGKVKTNMRVRVMGPKDIHQQSRKTSTSVEKIRLLLGQSLVTVEELVCGNIVAIDGLDNCISKTASLTDDDRLHSYPLRPMKFSVSPVVHVAVTPKDPSELPKLLSGLKYLTKLDPLVLWDVEESGEHSISGTTYLKFSKLQDLIYCHELHVQTLLKELENFIGGDEIEKSNPIVHFRETILNKSSRKVGFSSKLGHLHMLAAPLEEELSQNIWWFEPQVYGPNILWDSCKGGCEPYGEVKDLILGAFRSCASEGVLASEQLRGIAFEICDFSLQANACKILRNQLPHELKRAFLAAQLTANPRLQELIQVFEIEVMEKDIGAAYAVIDSIRGHVIEEDQEPKSHNYKLKVEASLRLSFDLYKRLNEVSSGRSFLQLLYQYWRTIPSDPLSPGSEAHQMVIEIRRRKGLKKEITSLKELDDNYSGSFPA